jgi:hypothetical protein
MMMAGGFLAATDKRYQKRLENSPASEQDSGDAPVPGTQAA